jgi:hypothetical protein
MPHAYLYKCDLTGSKNLRWVWCLSLLVIEEFKIFFVLQIS